MFLWTFKGVMPQNLPQQILQRIVRLLADGTSQQGVARMLGVSQKMHNENLAMQPRNWPTTSEEMWRFDENLYATGRPSTAPNDQDEPLHVGSSSANADDPPIWEADVSSNHSETASGHRILVSLWSRRVGPQTIETMYLQWWAPVLPIPQWRSGPGAP